MGKKGQKIGPKVPQYFWDFANFQGPTPTHPGGKVLAKSISPPPASDDSTRPILQADFHHITHNLAPDPTSLVGCSGEQCDPQ